MAQWLKQSTAVTVKIGPFVDDTDGKTAETGLTLSQADIRLSKNGGDIAQKNEANAATHDELGYYDCALDTTDTGTLGRLSLMVHESGALPVWHHYMVVPANVWDSMFGADYLYVDTKEIASAAVSTTTAQIGVNLVQISGDSTSADNLESYTDGTTPIPANMTQISGDATAADNAESFFDGTGYAGTNNVIPTVTTLTGHTAQTGDAFARLGAPAGASVSADVAAVKSDTAAILTDTGTTLDTLIKDIPTVAEFEARTLVAAGYATPTNITAGVITTVTNLTNERGKYALGSVWIGPAANTNTVSYVDGITTNPVSTIAAAKTIADALGMRRFEIIRTGTVQIGATLAGYRLSGVGWTCTTTGGSQDVGTTAFLGGNIASGTFASTTGTINWERCEFADGVSIGVANLVECRFQGGLTLNAAGNYDFVDCVSVVAGTGTPTFTVPSGTVNVSFRRWSGGITISGITSGTTISIDMVSGGTVTLNGADGNVQVRGMTAGITDNRTGTPTLGQNAAINMSKINAEVDTALADYDPPTNAEMEARTLVAASYATAAALATVDDFLDTEIAAILADTNELQTDWVNGGRLDLLIDAIKAKTDNLPSDPADQSAVEAAITAATSTLATSAEVGALNDVSTTDVQNAATAALNAYDPPTNAEMEARTLVAASYATATALATVDGIVDDILLDTAEIGTAGAGLTAVALASDGLDAISTAAPTGVASNFREMLVQVWRRYFAKSTMTASELKTYADNGTDVLTTQALSDDGTTQTLGAAS